NDHANRKVHDVTLGDKLLKFLYHHLPPGEWALPKHRRPGATEDHQISKVTAAITTCCLSSATAVKKTAHQHLINLASRRNSVCLLKSGDGFPGALAHHAIFGSGIKALRVEDALDVAHCLPHIDARSGLAAFAPAVRDFDRVRFRIGLTHLPEFSCITRALQ